MISHIVMSCWDRRLGELLSALAFDAEWGEYMLTLPSRVKICGRVGEMADKGAKSLYLLFNLVENVR